MDGGSLAVDLPLKIALANFKFTPHHRSVRAPFPASPPQKLPPLATVKPHCRPEKGILQVANHLNPLNPPLHATLGRPLTGQIPPVLGGNATLRD